MQERFDDENEELYEASFGAQFVSGVIMPAMMFVGNLTYVAIAVVGGLGRERPVSLGDIQAFIQYYAAVHPAARAVWLDGQRPPVRARVRRAGLRAPRREEQSPRRPPSRSLSPPAGASSSTTSASHTSRTSR